MKKILLLLIFSTPIIYGQQKLILLNQTLHFLNNPIKHETPPPPPPESHSDEIIISQELYNQMRDHLAGMPAGVIARGQKRLYIAQTLTGKKTSTGKTLNSDQIGIIQDALMDNENYATCANKLRNNSQEEQASPPPPPPHDHTPPPPPPPSSDSSEGSSASVDNTINMTQTEYEKALADAAASPPMFKKVAVNQIAQRVTKANSKAREDLVSALMTGTSYADFKAAHPDYFERTTTSSGAAPSADKMLTEAQYNTIKAISKHLPSNALVPRVIGVLPTVTYNEAETIAKTIKDATSYEDFKARLSGGSSPDPDPWTLENVGSKYADLVAHIRTYRLSTEFEGRTITQPLLSKIKRDIRAESGTTTSETITIFDELYKDVSPLDQILVLADTIDSHLEVDDENRDDQKHASDQQQDDDSSSSSSDSEEEDSDEEEDWD